MTHYLEIVLTCIFVNNILLAQFLGVCPFLGISKKMDTAIGMSMAVVFVMVISGAVTWIINNFVLAPLGIEYLRTISFIVVIASLVQLVEMFLQKNSPNLYTSLGIYLPLITTNCAIMGVCLINIKSDNSFIEAVVSSFAYAIGFGLALVLFAGIRERVQLSRVPKPLQDTSIGLITAGLISLAFYAFKGMI